MFLFFHISPVNHQGQGGLLNLLDKVKIFGYRPEVTYISTSDQPYSGKALILHSADGREGHWHWEWFLPTPPVPWDQDLHAFLNGHWLWHSWPQRQTESLTQADLAMVLGDLWMGHIAVLTWHVPFKFSFGQSCLSRYQEGLGYPHLAQHSFSAMPCYLSQLDHLPSIFSSYFSMPGS